MTDEVKQELKQLNQAITEKLGDYTSEKDDDIPDYFNLQSTNEDVTDDENVTPSFEPMEESIPEEYDPEILDQYLTAQVQLPLGDDLILGKVVARKRDAHGNPIGKSSENPIFDTRRYQVEFPDGRIEEYCANIIAECLYAQVDQEGNQYIIIS